MPDTRTVKKIFNWKPLSKRSQGRLKYRWEGNIKQDICQMKIKNWIACFQDRGKWKEVVEKAKIQLGSSAPGRRKRFYSIIVSIYFGTGETFYEICGCLYVNL
jgi:hypothetical protein